jgi:hypothetical protein
MDCVSSSATRTTSWTAAACSGDAPPSNIPTKAPGRVTKPTVRVWSRPGRRASAASSRATSSAESRGSIPIESAASYSPRRLRRAARACLPARVVAVIAPPIRMPTIGTTAMVWRGIRPLSIRPPATGAAPRTTGPSANHQLPPGLSRRPAVSEATQSISRTKPRVSHHERRTAVISRPTTTSCRDARMAARTSSRPSPRSPTRLTRAASPAQRTTTAARRTSPLTPCTLTSPLLGAVVRNALARAALTIAVVTITDRIMRQGRTREGRTDKSPKLRP